MRKFKKFAIMFILPLCFLLVLCFLATPNVKVLAESSTTLDESTATIKVTSGKEISYYESFSEAIDNSPSNATITLLKDATFSSKRGLRCSIDLNGNTLFGGGITVYTNNLTFLDSKGTGKISGNISFFESCNITIKSAGLIEYFYFINSVCSVLGGKINKLALNIDNTKISGGEIDNLIIYRAGSIHLSGGTINNFKFVDIPQNFNMLENDYIYANKVDNSPIKTSEMTPSTQVNIIKCPHPSFTNSVCDYCNYVCDHNDHFYSNGICDMCGYACPHENYFNENGICNDCGYACPHLELNDDNICLTCNNKIGVNLKNSSTVRNFINFNDAISAIQNGDTMTLYGDVKLNYSCEINVPCTIDLNGYAIDDYYVELNSNITIIDSRGNGYIPVSSSSTSSQIKLKGADTTKFLISLNKDRLKFYSGQIWAIEILNGTVNNILPSGYVLVKNDNTGFKKLTKQETDVRTYDTNNCYLTCEVCTHDLVDETLICHYCGETLTQEQVLKSLSSNLQSVKNELSESINKKEDVDSINEKINRLNSSISSAETICKAYSDDSNEQLRQDLQNQINLAKQDAISASNVALEQAKAELFEAISQKVDFQTYNQKIGALTTAILNAETSSKAYADAKDLELKTLLQSNINDSKTALQQANSIILERLSVAESKIENNEQFINSLKTTIIILSIVFAVIVSAGFTVLFIFVFKKRNKYSVRF